MEILATSTNKPAVVTPGSNVQRSAAPAPVLADSQPVVKPTTPAPAAAYQLEQVQRAIEQLKQSIKPALANSLEFEVDQSTGKTIVKIMDVETSRLIRQIPSEEMLIIAEALDRMQGRGVFVKQQA